MTYRTGKPTLRGVVDQIEKMEHPGQQPAIRANGRAVRLSKGKGVAGETIYDIRTRPVGKGREWNFARRIAQEKALVERFEKEIDESCGTGMGKKLTKSVGAYDKFLNPKLDAAQLKKLQKRADQIEKVGPPPPGLKVQFDDEDNLMWVGRFEMDAQARTTIKSGLAIEFSEAFRNSEQREIGWIALGNFLPMKWCRHPCIGEWTYGIGGARCPVFCILVVVEEHAMTFLFPPLRTRQLRYTTLDLARQRHRRASHFTEIPTLLNSNVDMHAARAAGLGPTTQSHLFEQCFHFERHQSNTFPFHSRTGI